jgi:hypothetical protein
MICPTCQRDAPTVVRGVRAYCTACGAQRPLTSGTPVSAAGQPSKVGGSVAGVLGWLVLFFGLSTAVAVGAFFQWLIVGGVVGWAIGLPIGIITLIIGLGLILGGKRLKKSGVEREREVKEQAILALAAQRQGSVTVRETARALAILDEEADALLTAMAKRPDGRVSLEVDDDGTLRYVVPEFAPLAPRMRVDGHAGAPRVRVPGATRPSSTRTSPIPAGCGGKSQDFRLKRTAEPGLRRASRSCASRVSTPITG